jgi:uncharacterized membrane protein
MNGSNTRVLGALFDFSFQSFLTSKVIKFLYVLSMIIVTLETIGFIIIAFKASAVFGAVTLLILGPIYFLLVMIWVRVVLELIMVFFRIHDDVREITRRVDPQAAAATSTAPLNTPAPAAPIAPSVEPTCPHCGAVRSSGQFCTSCGQSFD